MNIIKNIKHDLINELYNNILLNHFELLANIVSTYTDASNSKTKRTLILTDTYSAFGVIMSFGNNFKANAHLFYKVSRSEYLKLRVQWYVESILSKAISYPSYTNIETQQDRERLYSILIEYVYGTYTLDDIKNNMLDYNLKLIIEHNKMVSHTRTREGPVTKYSIKNKKWYLAHTIRSTTQQMDM